jgi:hypothetical protein
LQINNYSEINVKKVTAGFFLRRLVEEDSNILSNKRGKDIGLFYFLKLWLKNPKAVVEEGCYRLCTAKKILFQCYSKRIA